MIAAIRLAIGAEDVRQFNAASCRCQPPTGGQHGLGHGFTFIIEVIAEPWDTFSLSR